MSAAAWFICLCIFTVAVHVGLIFLRGWLIGQVRREQTKLRTEWERFLYVQAKWQERFEEEHQSPWQTTKKRSA